MTFEIREGEHLVLPLGWYTLVYTIPAFVQGRYSDGIWTEELVPASEVSRKVAILDQEDMSSFMKMYLPWQDGPCGIRHTDHGMLHLERMHASAAEAGLLLPPPLGLDEL
jgi:hypothetical protein